MALTKVSYSMINGAPINILDLGAVMNDAGAKTANTAALNAAINAGGTILIPNGTLYINPITLDGTKGFVLVGQGRDATIITGNGNLFTVTGTLSVFISMSSFSIRNQTTNGALFYMNAGSPTSGIAFNDITFGTCVNHFKADCLMVSQSFENSRFENHTGYSRTYNAGAYACQEDNCYTWNGFAGVFSTGYSFGNTINNSVFEQLQDRAFYINTGTSVSDVLTWTLNSCYYELCALADPTTIPYVQLNNSSGQRLWGVTFNSCSFNHNSGFGLLDYFVKIINPGGGTIQNFSFNNGECFGNFTHFANDTTAVVFNQFSFNSSSPEPDNLWGIALRYKDAFNLINYSVDLTGASTIIYTLAVGACITLDIRGTASGASTFAKYFVSYAVAGTAGIATAIVTNAGGPTITVTVSTAGVVTVGLSGVTPTGKCWLNGQP
jgi:hypothetical protein